MNRQRVMKSVAPCASGLDSGSNLGDSWTVSSLWQHHAPPRAPVVRKLDDPIIGFRDPSDHGIQIQNPEYRWVRGQRLTDFPAGRSFLD